MHFNIFCQHGVFYVKKIAFSELCFFQFSDFPVAPVTFFELHLCKYSQMACYVRI